MKVNHAKLAQWIIVLFLLQLILAMIPVINEYIERSDEISIEDIEIIIEDYAALCYATEGSYPADLDYLVENYGLILQKDRFEYRYEIFASNIMPEIKVFSKESDRGGEEEQ